MERTFTFTFDGLVLEVVATQAAPGDDITFEITAVQGFADINAIYWSDNDGSGDEGAINFDPDANTNLNMNGTEVLWDGAFKLSEPGITSEGSETFIEAGTANDSFSFTLTQAELGGFDLGDDGEDGVIARLGIRATTTSNDEGSIKGVTPPDEENTVPTAGAGSTVVSEEGLAGGNTDSAGYLLDLTDSALGTGTIGATDPDGDPLLITLTTSITDIIDSDGAPAALTSGGVAIFWTLADDDHTLIGSKGAGGDVIITIQIEDGDTANSSTGFFGSGVDTDGDLVPDALINAGDFLVTLSGPLDHPLTDDPLTLLVDETEDVISFTVGVSVDDGNGGVISSSITVEVEDDSPTVVVTAAADTLVLDETRPVGTEEDGDSDPAGLATVTASFADNFDSGGLTDYGSDGAGSTSYALVLTGGPDVASGLYALDAADTDDVGDDGDGIGQGDQIVLNQSGDTITGSAGGTDYFTISVDTTTGVVTFSQLANIWHSDPSDDDDTETLTAAAGALKITKTVVDADGDSETAEIDLSAGVFQIEDDGPAVASLAAALAVDEDDLPSGNSDVAGGDDLVDSSPLMVSGGLGVSFGTDGPGGVTSITYTAAALESQGGTVDFDFDGTDTLTAYVESGDAGGLDGLDRQVFTVVVAVGTGQYTFTLLDSLDHPDPTTEDNLVLTFDAVVTDGDGDAVTQALSVDVDDDSPVAITPESETLVNQGGSSSDDDLPLPFLDDDGNIDDDVGADQVGTIAFANITDGDQAQGVIDGDTVNLTSGGELIQLFLVDHDTDASTPDRLEGWTGGQGTGTPVFYLTLQPDGSLATSNDTYTVELLEQIGAITVTELEDLGFATAGNKAFNFLLADDPGTVATETLLFSSFELDASGTFDSIGTVNTNNTAIGVNNQSMNDGEVLGIDFVTNSSVTNSANNSYNYTAHYDINDFAFSIVQDNTPNNPAPNHIELWVRAYDSADDDPAGTSTATHHTALTPRLDATVPLDVQDPITSIVVNGVSLNIDTNLGDGLDTLVTMSGGRTWTTTPSAAGGYLIAGLNLLDRVTVSTADDYNRLEIENPLATAPSTLNGEAIDIGQFAFSRVVTNIPEVTMSYDLELTDGDGDSVLIEDAIQITLTAPTTPVVLDLDGDGLEFVAMDGRSPYGFDLDGDGIKEMSAWVGSDDGILVYDANGDKVANDMWEVVFSAHHPDARTDLEGLRLAFDSNGDGQLSALDAKFSSFGVWRDTNGNHVTDSGEFLSLKQLGIVSFNLSSDGVRYEAADGQVTVFGEGSFAYKNGSQGLLGDVSLKTGGEIFDYDSVSESTPAAPDTIWNFVDGGDLIDLAGIDANAATALEDDAFAFGGYDELVAANSVTWHQADGNTIVQGDVNGDTAADFRIELNGLHALSDSDFLL